MGKTIIKNYSRFSAKAGTKTIKPCQRLEGEVILTW